jgi:hypothetical protein
MASENVGLKGKLMEITANGIDVRSRLIALQDTVGKQCRDWTFRVSGKIQDNIIGPMEKGMEAARIQAPPQHVIDGVDLRVLPKFICYRAALLRERLSLQYGLAILTGVFIVVFISSRIEISHLYTKLREKEYILAPGVQDFTPAAPQSVPDSHVANAAMDFLQTFGNINPVNIDEQYARLEESMSPELKIRFELEASLWKAKVKSDGVSQIFEISDKEIRTKHDGYYEVTAVGKKESYVNNEHIGSTEQVVEMVLKLIPPQAGKRWYLEIEKLESHEANAFRVRNSGGAK